MYVNISCSIPVFNLKKYIYCIQQAIIIHLIISVRHGDAGDAIASPTLKNWPLFGQKFSKF